MNNSNGFLNSIPRRLRLQDFEFGMVLGEGKKSKLHLLNNLFLIYLKMIR